MTETEAREDAFPAPSTQVIGHVDGVETEVSRVNFSDKIIITVSQGGRVAHWVQVPLSASAASAVEMPLPDAGLTGMPMTHLTPKTLLGGGSEDRETLGQLYAGQIASFLTLRDPEEKRTLLLGLGFEKANSTRESFFDTIELVQQIL